MHDTSLEWTVFLDSFCLLQNYWTWKWCNDDNKMSFFSTIHIYLSLFYWYVVISVLTLFLRVGWIVSLHHATYSRDGGSIPVDHLLPPCFFSLKILSLTFHLPIPLFFHFRFILNFVWHLPTVSFLTSFSPTKVYSVPSTLFLFISLSFSFLFHFILFHFLSDFCLQFIIKLCSDNINKKLNVGISQKAYVK